MDSHITVQEDVPARIKRPSVGPDDRNGSPVEPSLAVAETYARKRPRISVENAVPAQLDNQPASPVPPASPPANAATQLLFGSSPLTEPEDDFPTVSTECDNTEDLEGEVLSSQQSERQDTVLDRAEDIKRATHTVVSAEGTQLSPPDAVDPEHQVDDDALMDAETDDAVIDTAKCVTSFAAVLEKPVESDITATDAHITNCVEVEVNQNQEDRIATAEIDKASETHLVRAANDPKTEIVLEDEPDDEFDDDPWFDAACLKSFDTIDASVKQSTAVETPALGVIPINVTRTPRVSPPPLSLQRRPLKPAQLPLFSEYFFDTRKAEEIDEKEIPVIVGFSTARGKKVAVPTTAAVQNARTAKLMQELLDIQNEVIVADKTAAEIVGKCDGDVALTGNGELHRPKQMPHLPLAAVLETPTRPRSSAFAFTTAGGSQLGAVSASARAAVDSIFKADSQPSQDRDFGKLDDVPVEHASPKASLFATMAGSTLATPSANAQKATAALFDDASQITSRPTDYTLHPANPTIMSLALPSNSFETPTKSVSRLGPSTQATAAEVTRPSVSRPKSLQDISNLQPSSPARQQSVSTFKTPIPVRMTHLASQAKLFQTPFSSHRQTRMSPAPAASTGTGLSPALPRRVGLGMTPRTQSGLRERPRFVSPFRTVVRDKEGEIVGSPNMKSKPGIRAIFSTPSMKQPKLPTFDAVPLQPCFELSCPTERTTLKKGGLKPGAYTPSALTTAGVPSEIILVNPATAPYYRFSYLGSMRGPQDVMKQFRAEGLGHVGIEWFENHWRMIVWKLASMVRAKPELFQEKWTYREVVRQMKYRYEREINRAHRSTVKRIQEQDSPPSLPMVLCVSAIISSPSDQVADGTNPPDCQSLELTDGWYIIRANVDAPICRALKKGKLRLGCKIAISGAKLDANREGTEVLEALNKSSLRITGNSTCLVEWDRRLGFTHKPFIATLRSLCPDGGNIPLLDVRISKVFPLAYITTEKGKGTSPWSAEEEYKLQDEWTERYAQERSRLQVESQRRMRGSEEDVETLRSAIEGLEGDSDASPCEDDELERFRATPTKSRYLKALSGKAVLSLFLKAQEEFQSELVSAQAELEEDLRRLCPPRSTRSFQIIRVVDAESHLYPQLREAQLQVWDAKQLGDKVLQEGARYQVSNLIPAQQKAWANLREKGEIYLSTGKGTTWKRCSD